MAGVFAGCVQTSSVDVEGIYTRESAGEFSRAFDTLIIFKYDSSATGSTYLIRRKTGIIRAKEGVPQPKEFKDEKMICVYDESTHQLMNKKTGRLFSFKDGELLFGTAEYKRVAR